MHDGGAHGTRRTVADGVQRNLQLPDQDSDGRPGDSRHVPPPPAHHHGLLPERLGAPFHPPSVAVLCGAAVGSCTLQHLSAVCVLGSWDSCIPLQTARSTRNFDITLSRHDCMASIVACSCSYHHLRALPLSYLRKLAWPVRTLSIVVHQLHQANRFSSIFFGTAINLCKWVLGIGQAIAMARVAGRVGRYSAGAERFHGKLQQDCCGRSKGQQEVEGWRSCLGLQVRRPPLKPEGFCCVPSSSSLIAWFGKVPNQR